MDLLQETIFCDSAMDSETLQETVNPRMSDPNSGGLEQGTYRILPVEGKESEEVQRRGHLVTILHKIGQQYYLNFNSPAQRLGDCLGPERVAASVVWEEIKGGILDMVAESRRGWLAWVPVSQRVRPSPAETAQNKKRIASTSCVDNRRQTSQSIPKRTRGHLAKERTVLDVQTMPSLGGVQEHYEKGRSQTKKTRISNRPINQVKKKSHENDIVRVNEALSNQYKGSQSTASRLKDEKESRTLVLSIVSLVVSSLVVGVGCWVCGDVVVTSWGLSTIVAIVLVITVAVVAVLGGRKEDCSGAADSVALAASVEVSEADDDESLAPSGVRVGSRGAILESTVLSVADKSDLMVRSSVDRAHAVDTSGQAIGDGSTKNITLSGIIEALEESKAGGVNGLGGLQVGNVLDGDVTVTDEDALVVDLLRSRVVVCLGVDKVTGDQVQDLHLDGEGLVLDEAFVSVLGEDELAAGGDVKTDDTAHRGLAARASGDLLTIGEGNTLVESNEAVHSSLQVVAGGGRANLCGIGVVTLTILLQALRDDGGIKSYSFQEIIDKSVTGVSAGYSRAE
ncbi:11210_t:CDS:10 [Acaulospora colombiana]|uniref:11210_t:CDS:1 n=1 Tax=Acaulospora colombiana TaxID=27376 RepID=A0ACA9MZV2_9GLOM|nr:11210_t:CDS:10 [Acaulospora colombiana]